MSDPAKISWTWRHAIAKSDLAAVTKHVLLTISLYMNDMGQGCYPTQEDLAAATSLSERAVRKHIDIAVKAGWLHRKEHGFRGQKWRNHEYEPRWPGTQDVDSPEQDVEKGAERGAAAKRKGAERGAGKVRNVVPPKVPELSKPSLRSGRARDSAWYDDLQQQLLQAARISGFRDERNPKLLNLAPIIGLLDAGYDLHTDILPAIRERCAAGFTPSSWTYFVKIVHERAGQRREAASVPKANTATAVKDWPDTKWQTILDYSRQRGEWSMTYGPPPFTDGCLVPPKLLQERDRDLRKVAA